MRVGVNSQNHQINHKEQTVPDQRANVIEVENNSLHQSTTEPPLPPSSSSAIRKPPPRLSSSPRGPTKDPEYLSLQKQHSALVLQLSKLRQALDTAQQALKIQSSNTDVELELVIGKWQRISREAAEELFASAKDRVNRMGGVGAWRERNQRQTQRWDEEEPVSQDALTDEQKDLIEEQKEEREAMNQKYGIEKVEQVVEEREDEVGLFAIFQFLIFETDRYY
jgi:SEL1 protein